MATTIAVYYASELAKWKQLIILYAEEMDDFEHKLDEVIRRNSIPDIAAKVEAQQSELNRVLGKFFRIRERIQKQESALKTNSDLIDDLSITAETEKQQNELRRSIQLTEKEYIEKKHECNNFLSGTLKK